MKEKRYIFYTAEGYTIAPDNSVLDSLQILGIQCGINYEAAFAQLLNENEWIYKCGFDVDKIEGRRLFD